MPISGELGIISNLEAFVCQMGSLLREGDRPGAGVTFVTTG